MHSPPLAAYEQIILEIPASPKTVTYYTLKAAPLFGVWFIGLMAFLIYAYKTTGQDPRNLLWQSLALAGFAYLIGVVARWLWRVDVSQRDAWLTTLGIWIQTPAGMKFIPYQSIAQVKEKFDWMETWLHLDEIKITYMEDGRTHTASLVGVEHPDEILLELKEKMAIHP